MTRVLLGLGFGLGLGRVSIGLGRIGLGLGLRRGWLNAGLALALALCALRWLQGLPLGTYFVLLVLALIKNGELIVGVSRTVRGVHTLLCHGARRRWGDP